MNRKFLSATFMVGVMMFLFISTALTAGASADSIPTPSPAPGPPPGFTGQTVQVLGPAGSTPVQLGGGVTTYLLPPGAIGEHFDWLPAGSTATTVPSTAVYPGAQPNVGAGGCDIGASYPFSQNRGVMDAQAATVCTGDTSGLSYIDVGVALDFLSASGWQQQNTNADATSQPPWSITTGTSHRCTSGYVHYWRTRANGHVRRYGNDYVGSTSAERGVKCL